MSDYLGYTNAVTNQVGFSGAPAYEGPYIPAPKKPIITRVRSWVGWKIHKLANRVAPREDRCWE